MTNILLLLILLCVNKVAFGFAICLFIIKHLADADKVKDDYNDWDGC